MTDQRLKPETDVLAELRGELVDLISLVDDDDVGPSVIGLHVRNMAAIYRAALDALLAIPAQREPDDQSLSNIADWLEQKGLGGSAKIVREADHALRVPAQSELSADHIGGVNDMILGRPWIATGPCVYSTENGKLDRILFVVKAPMGTRDVPTDYELSDYAHQIVRAVNGALPPQDAPAQSKLDRDIIANWIFSESDRFDLDDFGYAAADDLISRLSPSELPDGLPPPAGAGERNPATNSASPRPSLPPHDSATPGQEPFKWGGGADYAVWLVEINNDGTSEPVYFQFEHDNDWTTDHNKAAHFGRREDAQRAIDHYGWTEAKPVEHMWPSPRSQEETVSASAASSASVDDATRPPASAAMGLSAEVEALRRQVEGKPTPVFVKRPVAFRVRRTMNAGTQLAPDDWRLFNDEGEARQAAEQLDGDYQALFIRDGTAIVAEWQPIETAPKGNDDFFLVCGVGDDRSPFVMRGAILANAIGLGTPSHLSLHWLTHWMPLPALPSDDRA